MSLRFALPMIERRGAGLGNELILWGKAYIAGQALGMTTLHPAWGLNPRRYWRYFGTSRADWLGHRMLRAALPLVRFDEADYVESGGGDYHDAIGAFADRRGLRGSAPLVLGLTGLWGGPGLLGGARDFLFGELLRTRNTAANLYRVGRRMPPGTLHVGMHIRRGDFTAHQPGAGYAGRFNLTIPIDWYVSIARRLVRTFGDRLSLLVVSDATPDELAPLACEVPIVTTQDEQWRDASDMLALAACDFVLCSISSYSMWAAFFSRGRYGWLADHLSRHGDVGSIWGFQPAEQVPGSATMRATAAVTAPGAAGTFTGRGVPVGVDGRLSDELIADLESRLRLKQRESDLVAYGVLPWSQVQTATGR